MKSSIAILSVVLTLSLTSLSEAGKFRFGGSSGGSKGISIGSRSSNLGSSNRSLGISIGNKSSNFSNRSNGLGIKIGNTPNLNPHKGLGISIGNKLPHLQNKPFAPIHKKIITNKLPVLKHSGITVGIGHGGKINTIKKDCHIDHHYHCPIYTFPVCRHYHPTQTIVVEKQVIVEKPVVVEPLPQVPAGSTITLAAANIGPTGNVLLAVNGLSLPAQVINWNASGVTATLPMIGLAAPAKAKLVIVMANGQPAGEMEIELLPPQSVAAPAGLPLSGPAIR